MDQETSSPKNTTITRKQRQAQRREEKQQLREVQEKKKKSKKSANRLIWVGIIILIIAGVWKLGAKSGSNSPAQSPDSAVVSADLEVREDDHIKGNPDALVTLIEYSDFQCPSCANAYPQVKSYAQELGDELRVVYRHFPLRFHPFADEAARAAEAAHLQGKFWEMHDRLFEEQRNWSFGNAEALFEGYAVDLGLDVSRFLEDYESEAVEDRVDRDERTAKRLDVPGTPTFYLNGRQIKDFGSYNNLKSIIEQEIADAKIEPEEPEEIPELEDEEDDSLEETESSEQEEDQSEEAEDETAS